MNPVQNITQGCPQAHEGRRVRVHLLVAGALLVALLGSGPSLSVRMAGAGGLGDRIAIELDEEVQRPVAVVHLNGAGPFRFFVDTGAGGSLMKRSLAERLTVETVGRQTVFSPATGRSEEVPLVEVVRVEVAGVPLGRQRFMALDLPPLGDMDGVLSFRSLPTGLVTFDFPAHRILIEAGSLSPDAPDVIAYRAAPVVSVQGQVGNHPLTFHVDTGSPDGITLPGALAKELSFQGELETIRERPPLVVRSGRLLEVVRIGHIELVNPEVQVVDAFPDFGNIGMAFLRDRVLTIDRDHQLLRITPIKVPGT